MKEYVIETKEVIKTYGSFLALDQVSIHVERGCIYGLIGDNGAGKSTLLKILAGQSFKTAGQICILGEFEERGLKRIRKRIGCMVEQPGFFPNMTVEQTLHYYGIQKGIPDLGKIPGMLELIGLLGKRKSRCRTLSQGQKQRLGLGIAMLGEPQVLVLDEPINGLDPSGIIEFRSLLHRLNNERNITILLSSHILSELQQTAQVFGFLSGGRLMEETTAELLQEKCADYMEIGVSDVEGFAVLLEQEFPAEDYKVLPENKVRIRKPRQAAEVYSRQAAERGIYITEMQTLRSSLEDYYMELKERSAKRC